MPSANHIFQLDTKEFDRLAEAAKTLADDAEKAINEGLASQAVVTTLIDSITELTPVSNRPIFPSHKRHAKTSKPYQGQNGNLSVTIKSTKPFNYLYFPDDGSNTQRHAGMQQFMFRGAEKVKDKVIDILVDKILNYTEL